MDSHSNCTCQVLDDTCNPSASKTQSDIYTNLEGILATKPPPESVCIIELDSESYKVPDTVSEHLVARHYSFQASSPCSILQRSYRSHSTALLEVPRYPKGFYRKPRTRSWSHVLDTNWRLSPLHNSAQSDCSKAFSFPIDKMMANHFNVSTNQPTNATGKSESGLRIGSGRFARLNKVIPVEIHVESKQDNIHRMSSLSVSELQSCQKSQQLIEWQKTKCDSAKPESNNRHPIMNSSSITSIWTVSQEQLPTTAEQTKNSTFQETETSPIKPSIVSDKPNTQMECIKTTGQLPLNISRIANALQVCQCKLLCYAVLMICAWSMQSLICLL